MEKVERVFFAFNARESIDAIVIYHWDHAQFQQDKGFHKEFTIFWAEVPRKSAIDLMTLDRQVIFAPQPAENFPVDKSFKVASTSLSNVTKTFQVTILDQLKSQHLDYFWKVPWKWLQCCTIFGKSLVIMGGYNAAGVFDLAEHKCGRNNATHQRRLDEWMTILKAYSEPRTQDVTTLYERLQVALEKLKQTELWVRFRSEEEVDLDSDSEDSNSFDDLCEDSEEEKPNACNGCAHARMFYRGGPLTLICCLDEDWQKLDRDQEICSTALAAISAEIPTAKNIQDHARELYLE